MGSDRIPHDGEQKGAAGGRVGRDLLARSPEKETPLNLRPECEGAGEPFQGK